MSVILNKYLKCFIALSVIYCMAPEASEEDVNELKPTDKTTAPMKRKVRSNELKENEFEPNKQAKTNKKAVPTQRNRPHQGKNDVEINNPQGEDNDWVKEAEKVMDYLESRDKIESGEYNKSEARLD